MRSARLSHQGERRQLCVEMEALKERLFRAGLYETAQKMNEACQIVGYECANQFTKETDPVGAEEVRSE